jgi:2-amino-4-hydroxy-6-hydroxymethyldihydropteridine diphosphokinase
MHLLAKIKDLTIHNMQDEIYLLLGSNMGNRIAFLAKAIEKLIANGIEVEQTSAIYETAAWGLQDQATFLNQLLKVRTHLAPDALLKQTQCIEQYAQRQRKQHWGPRTLDIDILYYNQAVINSPSLNIPHPRIAERRFCLVPLVELAPQFIHPVLQKTNFTLLEECQDSLAVTIFN